MRTRYCISFKRVRHSLTHTTVLRVASFGTVVENTEAASLAPDQPFRQDTSSKQSLSNRNKVCLIRKGSLLFSYRLSRCATDHMYNQKRQRRQAAGVVVQSLLDTGRKSTAQPRPVLNVPPRGIGPISDPNENDVLCGRGGRINSHAGNVKFRDVINAKKKEYLAPTTKKLEKAHIAASIVNEIRGMNPPGRFLKEDRDTGLWFDIGDAKAIKKAGQALREDAPDIRPEIGDSSGDEKQSPKKGEKSNETEKKLAAKREKTPSKLSKAKNSQSRYIPQPHQASGNDPNYTLENDGIWAQGNENFGMTAQEYQAQVAAMPPPFSQQTNPYVNQAQQVPAQMQVQNTNRFGIRNIPITSPNTQGLHDVPNQIYSGARSVGHGGMVGGKVASMSKQAMDTLSQSGKGVPFGRNAVERNQNDVAFGLPFHPPSVLSAGGNTMSTVSGLSDPLSSGIGMDTASGTGGPRGRAGTSPARPRDEYFRLSQVMGQSTVSSNRSRFSSRFSGLTEPMQRLESSRLSDMTTSMRSINSGMGSISLPRSNSFPDMSSLGEYGEPSDEDMLEAQLQSLLSGESSGRVSVGSVLARMGGARGSSAMSIASQSSASSNQLLASFRDSALMDDGRSILSEMSSDLNALDLAARPH